MTNAYRFVDYWQLKMSSTTKTSPRWELYVLVMKILGDIHYSTTKMNKEAIDRCLEDLENGEEDEAAIYSAAVPEKSNKCRDHN